VGSSLCRVKPKIIKFVFAASPLSKAGKDIFKSKNNHLLLIMNNKNVSIKDWLAQNQDNNVSEWRDMSGYLQTVVLVINH
jgi:hypothetical protein